MMMMLDQNKVSQSRFLISNVTHSLALSFVSAIFHTIITASGHNVSLTPLHLIPIIEVDHRINYIAAKRVKIGDTLYVISDGELVPSQVINVIIEMKTGHYAPLTTSGRKK